MKIYIFFLGHIGIAVPDVYAACKLFEENGVTFVKKPDDGNFFYAILCDYFIGLHDILHVMHMISRSL